MRIENNLFAEEDVRRYSNRYLHCANSDTFIMAGSLPVVRFGKRRALLGSFRFFDENGAALDEKPGVTARYGAGFAQWEVGGQLITVGAPEGWHAAVIKVCGGVLRAQFGGVHYVPTKEDGVWNICPPYDGNYDTVAFDPAQKGESYTPVEGGFLVYRQEVDEYLLRHTGKKLRLYLQASFPMRIEDGLAVGECQGEGYLGVFLCEEGQQPLPLEQAFSLAMQRAERLSSRLRVSTPVPELDAACAYEANYQDGCWYPPRMMHASMTWNMPYLGWTNRYGNTVLGWHDRTLQEVRYYASAQITQDTLTGAPQGKQNRGTMPDLRSRFYGRGYINEDQHFYCMQSLFFDQAIYSWRATGDEQLAQTLRPMLEEHCRWLDDCFDRGGIYESVIDTWPTDTVWNDGGGAPEATCFALRAHEAARDMAALDGDVQAEKRHGEAAQRIRTAFRQKLWSSRLGVAGKCREQGTDRLLENPWSYSVFMPIDMDILSQTDAAQSLYYSKWAYQSDPTPHGRVIFHSNWLPMVWSVRPNGGGEQYMLANAFFKTGLPEDGMALLRGMLEPHIGLNGKPATGMNIGSDGSRAVLEGLFGYHPDYPHGRVALWPILPFDWHDARLETSDVKLIYHRDGEKTVLEYTLRQKAEVEIRLPVYAEALEKAEGARLAGLVPGFGRTVAVLRNESGDSGRIVLYTRGEKAPLSPVELTARPGEAVQLACTAAPAQLLDPQQALTGVQQSGAGYTAAAAENSGHHWLCAVIGGGMPRYEVFHLQTAPTQAEEDLQRRLHPQLAGCSDYAPVDVSPLFNCDVQKIYRQQYLSPRPETVSARLGVDGYTAWTMDFWGNQPPEIRLEKTGTVRTGQGVPLTVAAGEKNIAFVSRWDNFPGQVSLPLSGSAKAAVVLLCGTTNPMQCGVENLRLEFRYTDGTLDSVPLRNPFEFWSLCPLYVMPSSNTQVDSTKSDYDYSTSAFCLPQTPPETLQLGKNCRAVAVSWQLRDKPLAQLTVSATAKEVVIGVMAVTLVR